MSLGDKLQAQPAPDYGAALERFAALRALDGARIAPASGSQLYVRGERVRLAVVLVHGLTNAPPQWEPFARELHARGHNVLIPRLPGHGHLDHATTTIAKVTGDDLLATLAEAVDIACGLGDRVVLAGLSIGGSLAAWLALSHERIARSVCIVPFFGIKNFGETGNRIVASALAILPNAFVPWDPGSDGSQTPAYGYRKFPTRLLAQNVRVGLDVVRRVRDGARTRGEIAFLLNTREPACDNSLSFRVAHTLALAHPALVRYVVLDSLPANHDIIDPTNPKERVAIVYPRVRSLIEDAF